MKKTLLSIAFVFAAIIYVQAQTAGTLSFSVGPTSHNASFGYDHYVAIWIENNSNTFVKTKLKRADSHGTTSHLPVWKASSGSNTVDAVTGASYTNYNTPCTITWDGTDVSGLWLPMVLTKSGLNSHGHMEDQLQIQRILL